MPTFLMNCSTVSTISILLSMRISRCLPYGIYYILVIQLFKDPIASNNDEVVIVSNLKASDIWCRDNYLDISTVLRILGFYISDSPRHRKSAWENSVWSNDQLHLALSLWAHIWNIILVLVNASTISFDSFSFILTLGLVIFTQMNELDEQVDVVKSNQHRDLLAEIRIKQKNM